MNKVETAAGIAVIGLAAAGIGQRVVELNRLSHAPDPSRVVAPGTPVDAAATNVEAAISAFLASIDGAPEADRIVRVGELISRLESEELIDEDIDSASAEKLSVAVVDAVGKSPDQTPEGLELKRKAVGFLASRVASATSKEFILKVMADGPRELRDEAVSSVGTPRGVRGPAVYAKIQELADNSMVPDSILPQALRRTGGLKARGPLLALMKSTDSATLVAGCAVALQDYRDPEVIGDVLERLEQIGRLDSAAKLPWLSGGLLDEYMKTADKVQFRRGLTAMAARPGLARIDHLRKGVGSDDAETRRVAAEAVKKAAVAKTIEVNVAEELLAGRLQTETEPVLKAALTGNLERVKSLQHETQQ